MFDEQIFSHRYHGDNIIQEMYLRNLQLGRQGGNQEGLRKGNH